tara:strand:- start:1292 stop:2044 length:753 start_codon:yes stop_codon:yes gene_type:complete
MKRYRIDGCRWGGELTIGKISPAFARYWEDRDQDELVEHLIELEDGEGTDPDSPAIFDDSEYSMWHDIDDFTHISAANDDDGNFTVHDVSSVLLENSDDYNAELYEYDEDHKTVKAHLLGAMDVVVNNSEPDPKIELDPEDDFAPVLVFNSAEKGSFGSWFVELLDNEEFDDKKLVYTITETDYGDYVDKVFYNKIELEAHHDDCDSRGKGYFAMVGWLNTRWHGQGDWTTEELTSAWNEYEFQMSSENP